MPRNSTQVWMSHAPGCHDTAATQQDGKLEIRHQNPLQLLVSFEMSSSDNAGLTAMPGMISLDCLDKVFRRVAGILFLRGSTNFLCSDL